MRLTFFGPPGSGKGTQANRISNYFNLEHISTGLYFRDEISRGSELGKRITEIVKSGYLVSDEIVNKVVFNRLENIYEFLLDGYPRNLPQAESLDEFLENSGKPLSGAVLIQVPEEEILRRLTGRLVCACTNKGVSDDSIHEGDICPKCGEPFVKRSDDDIKVISNRLDQYYSLTRHLEKYYRKRLLEIDGFGTVDQVFERIKEKLVKWE